MGVGKRIRQLAGESMVYGVSGTIDKFARFLLVPVYARVFLPSEYGIVALITSLANLVGMFVILGLDSSSGRWFYDTDDTNDRKRTIASWFWCQLSAGAAVGLVLFLGAPGIAAVLLGTEQHATLIRLVAVIAPLGTFAKVLPNWLRYQRRAVATAVVTVARSLVTVGITILFVVALGWGLAGIYWAALAAAGLFALAGIGIMRSWIGPAQVSMARLKAMLRFGLPLIPAAVASWVALFSDRFVLKLFRDAAEVGLYSVAATVAAAVALVTGAFRQAWGPFAFSIHREGDARDVYAKVLDLYALIGCFLCTALSLFSAPLLTIVATERYASAAPCVPFLAFSALLMGGLYIASIGTSIAKKSRPIAAAIITGACVNLALNFALIPGHGMYGAAIATVISHFCGVVYLFRASQRNHHIPYRFAPALACLGFSGALVAVGQLGVTQTGVLAFGIRAAMCLTLVPLGIVLGMLKLPRS